MPTRIPLRVESHLHFVKEMRLHAFTAFGLFALMILVSFGIQEWTLQQRNTSRDLHSHLQTMVVETLELGSTASAIFVSINNSERTTFTTILTQFQDEHAYAQTHQFDASATALFLGAETTYSNIVTDGTTIQQNTQAVGPLLRLFVEETTAYGAVLTKMYMIYTDILATNNTSVQVYSIIEAVSELLILFIFTSIVFFPSLNRLKGSVQDYVSAQSRADSIIQELPAEVHNLPIDVRQVEQNVYAVKGNGQVYMVHYLDETKTFVCKCGIFKEIGTCLHIRRAYWLQRQQWKTTREHQLLWQSDQQRTVHVPHQ